MLRPGDLQQSGITRSTLLKSWTIVRKSIRQTYRRDTLDFLEQDINPTVWIRRLYDEIRQGRYQPDQPERFHIAKSNGFKRQITRASIPDAVLYRTVVDIIYEPFRKYTVKHAYFARTELAEHHQSVKNGPPEDDSERDEEQDGDDYKADPFSSRFLIQPFSTWKEFQQYRKLLIFEDVHPYIICTDITNFFDSILHNQVHKTLSDISIPRSVTELLLLLLERLSARAPLTSSPGIGLPVEEFGCSRSLAHVLLFAHDLRMVQLVGEANYARWMDDQNLGVKAYSTALHLMAEIQSSLSRLHLTPNSGKTKILTIQEATQFYHLSANATLDDLDTSKSRAQGTDFRRELLGAWKSARYSEGKGEFSKILKRFYRLAALCRSRVFIHRAHQDVLRYPELAPRVIDYYRCVVTSARFVRFAKEILADENQVYEDATVAIFETFLKLIADPKDGKEILRLAEAVFGGKCSIVGAHECAIISPLLFLRYGDKRTLRRLETALNLSPATIAPSATRAVGVVLAGTSLQNYGVVKSCAARQHRNVLSTIVRMVEEILNYKTVPRRFKDRVKLNYDALQRQNAVDMRALATLKLLALNQNQEVQRWVGSIIEYFIKNNVSDFDVKMLTRHFPEHVETAKRARASGKASSRFASPPGQRRNSPKNR